jgi:hypothetical protein
VVDRSGRLFWGYLVCRGKWPPVDDGYELVFCPRVFVVVEALPERRHPPLNLARVRLELESAWCTYLQLPHGGLAVVLWASVDAQSDQISPVHALFTQTLFALLCPYRSLLLQLPSLALRLGLSSWLEGGVACLRASANA